MQILQNHPISNIFPSMSPEDYARLVESIRVNGLLEPIWLFDDQILDGRHRYRACNETGTKPKFQIFTGNEEAAMAFSLSRNLERRHLTTEQKAALGVSIKAYEAERARERQATSTGGTNPQLMENFPQADAGTARDKAGQAVGVAGKTIDKAEKIAEAAPDVFERMKQGQYGSVETARKVADLPQPERVVVHQAMDEGVPAREAVKTRLVQHSTETDEWYTPHKYLDAARHVLGGIDLDPASSVTANQRVQAERFYTQNEDGLARSWRARTIWNNPPYSDNAKWVPRWHQASVSGEAEAGIILVFANTDTAWFQCLWHHWLCFTDHRIRHERPDGSSGDSPPKGSVFAYFGPNPQAFRARFAQFGQIVPPAR